MDNNQYLEMFLQESQEHIESLNNNLLDLEKNSNDKHIIDEIFRSAHTIKGMAATMGFGNMNKLSHKMEDLLQDIRNNTIEVTDNVMEILFKCVDTLSEMIDLITEKGDDTLNAEDLINLLDNINSDKNEIAATNIKVTPRETEQDINIYEKDIIEEGLKQGYKSFRIKIVIDKSCIMKSARAFIIFNELEKIGNIINSSPSIEDIEDEKFESEFSIHLLSKFDKEYIKEKLLSISELSEITIEEILLPREISKVEKKENNEIKNVQKNTKTTKTVRVDIEKLDNLMNLVSELIIVKTRLEDIESDSRNSEKASTIEYLQRITTNLHDAVMKVRMVPVEIVFSRFPRMVRDVSRELNKKITLNMHGEETEVDRTIIDEIGDPLVHLIRNSIDHGIEMPEERIKMKKSETGIINLKAYHEGNNVIIEVSDDGAGIDLDKIKTKAIEKGFMSKEELNQISKDKIIKILFEPGFSTSDKISDISGRGVGLDVVKTKIEALNGDVDVITEKNKGTKFVIKLPLTLAIIQALLVKVGDEKYAFPLNSISEVVHKNINEIHKVQGKEVILYRGKVIPLIRLNEILEIENTGLNVDLICVILKKGENLAACIIDELIGQQEIVIKPLGKYLSNIKIVSGATILGDGQVALIIDSNNLF
jgi:two-component system chemotaxis sensor kinase CheA